MPQSDPLDRLRSQIDAIDDQLVRLLNERAKVALDIGKLKKERDTDLYAPAREREVRDRLIKGNPGPFPNKFLGSIVHEVMRGTLSIQQADANIDGAAPLAFPVEGALPSSEINGGGTVAYLGPDGTFTHLACIQRFGSSAHVQSAPTIKAVFEAVEQGKVDYGMVPVENSIEGVVNHTLDLFADSPVFIAGEVLQPVAHFLMSKTGTRDGITTIYSHPHAVAQCSRFLESQYAGVPIVEVESTAAAARKASEQKSAGAIASELAATIYGLKIIEKNIEDYHNNVTRFLLLSLKPIKKTGTDKTSILFSIEDRAGRLYEVLQPFAQQEINMTRIESRPSKKRPWEYLFYIDLIGHPDDEKMQMALRQLEEKAVFVKTLGSYKAADLAKGRDSR